MEITSPKGRKFTSIQQMTNAIQQDLDKISRKVLEDVAEEVRLKMEELILNFYDDYRPKYYERTGGCLLYTSPVYLMRLEILSLKYIKPQKAIK